MPEVIGVASGGKSGIGAVSCPLCPLAEVETEVFEETTDSDNDEDDWTM